MISCIIPAFNEENYIRDCLFSLLKSADHCNEAVELLVINNSSTDRTLQKALAIVDQRVKVFHQPILGREITKNRGATHASGETLVFIDADCKVSENFFSKISQLTSNNFFIGGGTRQVRCDRWSLGIVVYFLYWFIYCYTRHITVGAFWVKKRVFEAIGGFNITSHYDDIDFALRLKRYTENTLNETKSIRDSLLLWSTRKFNREGDWSWLKGMRRFNWSTIR